MCNLIWMTHCNLTSSLFHLICMDVLTGYKQNKVCTRVFSFLFDILWHFFQLALHVMVLLLLQTPCDFIPFSYFSSPFLAIYLETSFVLLSDHRIFLLYANFKKVFKD